jgi:crotonobetainyl-CoA:carnitine CoA-transferase CaiB-like acyl-CoA transferase
MVPPKIGDEAAPFQMMNRNKRGIALDLKTDGGKEVLRRLIRRAR